MSIKNELIAIQKRDGILRPEMAVTWAASHPKSELHKALEWDDTEAAQQYRIWQVRHLIAVHIVNEKGVRQILSLSVDRSNGGGYRDIGSIMASPPLREILLADALAELERVRLKYHGLRELARLWDELRNVAKKSRVIVRPTKQAKHRGSMSINIDRRDSLGATK